MGVSIESYRSHIGSFAAVCSRLTKHSLRSTSHRMKHAGRTVSPLLRILPLLVVSVLLIIGGVEVNPGPGVRDCCGEKFKDASGYVKHVKAAKHPLTGNKLPCAFLDCASVLSSTASLEVHVSRAHSRNDIETFQCPVSDCNVTSYKTFQAHLENHLKEGKSFLCPFGSCSSMHQSLSGFKSHMTRFHPKISCVPSADIAEFQTEFASSSSSASDSSHIVCEETEVGFIPSALSASSSGHIVCNETEVESNPPEKKRKISALCHDPSPSTSSEEPPSKLPIPRTITVQDEILQFYLDLEGKHIIPSSTVQVINDKIKLFMEVSHQCLKEAVKQEMVAVGMDSQLSDYVIKNAFREDPVYNTHHKGLDSHQLTSTYLRKEMMKKKCPFVDIKELDLGLDSFGKRRVAHYVPIQKMLEVLLLDNDFKKEVVKSFLQDSQESDILADFTDGRIFKQHRKDCHKKCILLIFFQDGFEFNPFGPAKGLYKSIGFYYIIGNLPKEYRSQVKNILLALLLPEHNLKPTEEEFLAGINMFEKPLEDLIADLTTLHENGVLIDNETFPVCVLFCTGDNLGSNQIAGLVQSFTAKYCCRVCPISMDDFKKDPTRLEIPRTPEQYEECVTKAKELFDTKKADALARYANQKQHQEDRASKRKLDLTYKKISKSAYDDLKSVNYLGVKYYPSPLNKIPGFHVCASTLPPCIAHDLFQGVVSLDVAKILENLIEVKQWFSLETLNRRITQFKYKDNDAADAPGIIKSFDGIKNHAIENWNLVRLLPLIISDLVKDNNDPMWQLFLQLKEICELAAAPKIHRNQVLYLSSVIKSYLTNLQIHLPACLTPKHHFMMHYPELIFEYGPLINLFTMRFESNHVFFKNVGKACKSFQNISATLANKYQYKFASDHFDGILPQTVVFSSSSSTITLSPDEQAILPPELREESSASVTDAISIKGTTYKLGQWLIFNKAGASDLCVGCIETIYCFPKNSIYFKLRQHIAENTLRGFYSIHHSSIGYCVQNSQDLPDFYPLPSYSVQGKQCLTLKHSNIFM